MPKTNIKDIKFEEKMKRFYYLLFLLAISLNINVVSALHPVKVNQEKYKKTVFLTGAAGFIGSNFLKYMFDKYPDYYFLVLDALTYAGSLENIPENIKRSDRFEFWYGSVTNYEMVSMLMRRSHYVVHFAAESHVSRSIFDNSTFYVTDVIGTQIMMNALLKNKNVERFIHISTSEVYGTALSHPMDELHILDPRSPYAGAKAGADRLVASYWHTYNIPVVIIRPFNNYGPQQHTEKMIPRFVTSALKKKPLTVHGAGDAKRDWIHVKDNCRALDKVLHMDNFDSVKKQVINIGSGISTSVLEIAKMILDYMKLPYDDYLKFIGDRPGQVDCHISSTDKSKQLLDWEPQIALEDGIKEVVEWYRNNESRQKE